jgi:hypothetical protein
MDFPLKKNTNRVFEHKKTISQAESLNPCCSAWTGQNRVIWKTLS